jgi:2-octaprenylphenol hydroxylase
LLSRKSDHVLGELKVISEKAIYPLIYQHSKKYIEKNFVLVGDAAHTIHPLAGQGVNLGIADAVELTGVLEDSIMKGGYIGDISTLRAYERSRKSSNSLMLNFVHILNKLFSSRYITIRNMRKMGMKIFNKTELIKHQAIKTALGV